MIKLKSIHTALIISMLTWSCGADNSSKKTLQKPNILLVVADDLGYTDLGSFGGEIRTPNLDALAVEGIRNTAFYTAPTCSPTRAMLLSGVDNHRNGYGTMEGDWAENQKGVKGYEGHLNFDVVTFPKLLQDAGYHTSIAGKWHQAFPANDSTLWPEKRGFDRSFNLMQGGAGHFSDQQPLFSFFGRTYYIEDGNIIEKLPDDFYSSDYYAAKTIEYIDESQKLNKPFFTYLSFTAPHWPLQVPNKYIDLYKSRYDSGYEVLAEERLKMAKEAGIVDEATKLPPLSPNVLPWNKLSPEEQKTSSRTMEIYAAMVERVDANFGKVVEHLKSIGQYDNTLIIFMSDNGAEGNSIWGVADTREWVDVNYDNSLDNMGRKNSYIFTGPSWAQVSSLPFKWYKSFSTEGGVRSPAIISYPKWRHNSGKINEDYISVMDLAPTILDIAGVEHPGKQYKARGIYPMDGVSLVSWLKGKEESAHQTDEVHCWELYGRIGVRQGDWKAEMYDKPYGNGTWQLYNLKADPSELNDLASDNSAQLAVLKKAWDDYKIKYDVILPSEHVAYGSDDIWRTEK